MIRLHSIARQNSEQPVMEELFAGEISATEGLLGDMSPVSASGGISVLSKDSWIKVCCEADCELPWFAYGANLLIKGFEFLPTDIGRILRIGDVVLEIAGAHAPCTALENRAPALYEALLLGWRGGVVCSVLRSGTIQTGDDVDIVD